MDDKPDAPIVNESVIKKAQKAWAARIYTTYASAFLFFSVTVSCIINENYDWHIVLYSMFLGHTLAKVRQNEKDANDSLRFLRTGKP